VPQYPLARWRLLGELLAARRADLGYRHVREFCYPDRPGGLSEPLIRVVEKARRQNIAPGTIIKLEARSAYNLRHGAIDDLLAGRTDTLAWADPLDSLDPGNLEAAITTLSAVRDALERRAAG
jgi:hypothetical protein